MMRHWSETTKELVYFCVLCLGLGYVLPGTVNAYQGDALRVHSGLIIFTAPLMLKKQYSIHQKKRGAARRDVGRRGRVDWGSPLAVIVIFFLLAILNIFGLHCFHKLKSHDVNSMGALFVGVQWCLIYLVRGVVIEDFLTHFKRLIRVVPALLGFLVGVFGLPWGFPLVIVISELFLGVVNELSLKNRDA